MNYNRFNFLTVEDELQAIVDTGHEVGEVACRRYPAGHRVAHDHRHFAQALEETRQVVGADSAPAVFEATFAHGQVLVGADIIEHLPAGGWRLVEVLVGAAGLAEVDVLHTGQVSELGPPQPIRHLPGVAFGELSVDEQPEAFFERQGVELG